ncbi:iron-sulfur cluster assembly protein [Fodinisporobacter ferrooxydans]|uniref:Iron-sulfur cluster assembly protein n=1 Tax=Fodinisporobacter ferrooxydans TaxID=2901836 RepID=A0ABY4CU68_9BACL|nr:iron-sulfur cluster assembly protein [Alicyclobacillaceae bacterium MYW30-H2]
MDLEKVREQLLEVYDPELGLNVVELGLIYHMEEVADGQLVIDMTLTTPGCPMHDTMSEAVEWAAGRVDGVEDVRVNVVWNPPWTPARMNDQARAKLGF